MIAEIDPSPCASSRILVVSHGEADRSRLNAIFVESNFDVSHAAGVIEAGAAMASEAFDLVVVDDEGTGDLWRQIADQSHAPLLLLAGSAGVIERILALELGVDAVMTKPVHHRELMSTAKALIRRTRRVLAAAARVRDAKPGWSLDVRTRMFTGPAGSTASLSPSELALLQLFLSHPGVPVSAEKVEGAMDEGSASRVNFRVTLARLRRRLEQAGYPADVIRTIRGVGYVFLPDEAPAGGPEVATISTTSRSVRVAGVLH